MGALFDLARMTTATTGTGTITLGSAVSGFLTFAQSGVADGQTVSYGISDGVNSEVGQGAYTASGTTLTRTVLKSTNSNAAISLSGNAQVFVTALAEDFATYLPLAGGTLTGSLNMTSGNFYQYNGQNLAYIVPNSGGDNVFLGESGNTTTTGSSNGGNGFGALAALTTGNNNIAVGRAALTALTTGSNNAAMGYLALTSEQTGTYNFGLGTQALNTQNGASRNVGIGAIAGYDLTTGSNNVCVGYSTGRGITTGSGNTVIGYSLTGLPAALANTLILGAGGTRFIINIGTNQFFGQSTGNLTLTGGQNCAIGYATAGALTTGASNSAFGGSALNAETTGSSNTAIGKNAISAQNGASNNTAVGTSAGSAITTGSNNVFVGASCGGGLTTGSGNTVIGYSITGLPTAQQNAIIIGAGGVVRYDWNYTTTNTHTFTGGPVAQNATPTAGATPVFQSAGALSQASATTNTPALPASRTNGWLMIAFCRVTGATGTTITCPTSGWTQILNVLGSGSHYFMAAYAYVTGSEVAPVFTLGTSDTSDAQVVMYSGTAATNPIGAFLQSNGGSGLNIALGNITTTRYNSKVIAAILASGLSSAITPPAAFTQQVSNTDGAWFDAAPTAAGTSVGGTFTVSPAISSFGAFLVELLIPPMTPTAVRHNGQVLGTTRWSIELTDGTQETGSNVGSNFAIQRCSDAGAAIDTPISINRATGQTTITNLNPAVLLRSYLAGLALSTAGSSATFTVAAGIAVDSTNANIMSRTASLSKTTSTWAVGAAAGSLDTGTIAASTWYHVHLIMRTDTGVVDVLTSLSATAPTLPANYTLFRRIGSMLTDSGSHWTKFLQTGDIFEWDAGFSEISGGSLATGSAVTVTLGGVPTGVKVHADISGYATSTTAAATIAAWDADITGHATNSFMFIIPSANGEGSFCCEMMVNTSAQFKWQTSAALTSVNLFTAGWTDRRGRDA